MRDLLILGTGVHAAEMVEIVERVNRAAPAWNLLGLISPDEKPALPLLNGCPVLGLPDGLAQCPDACLVPDNEWPGWLPVPHERLASLVDPGAFVSRAARIGVGCVIYPGCFIGLNAVIGDRVFVLSGGAINHDCVLEDRVVVASGVTLAGSVHVETDCYLGQASTVRQYLRIGRGSLVGMGAVVVRDVAPNSVVAGNPARRLRDRYSDPSEPAGEAAVNRSEVEGTSER